MIEPVPKMLFVAPINDGIWSTLFEDEFQLKFSDHEFRRIVSIRGARHANAAKLPLKHVA
jgi:hypothetical protein